MINEIDAGGPAYAPRHHDKFSQLKQQETDDPGRENFTVGEDTLLAHPDLLGRKNIDTEKLKALYEQFSTLHDDKSMTEDEFDQLMDLVDQGAADRNEASATNGPTAYGPGEGPGNAGPTDTSSAVPPANVGPTEFAPGGGPGDPTPATPSAGSGTTETSTTVPAADVGATEPGGGSVAQDPKSRWFGVPPEVKDQIGKWTTAQDTQKFLIDTYREAPHVFETLMNTIEEVPEIANDTAKLEKTKSLIEETGQLGKDLIDAAKGHPEALKQIVDNAGPITDTYKKAFGEVLRAHPGIETEEALRITYKAVGKGIARAVPILSVAVAAWDGSEFVKKARDGRLSNNTKSLYAGVFGLDAVAATSDLFDWTGVGAVVGIGTALATIPLGARAEANLEEDVAYYNAHGKARPDGPTPEEQLRDRFGMTDDQIAQIRQLGYTNLFDGGDGNTQATLMAFDVLNEGRADRKVTGDEIVGILQNIANRYPDQQSRDRALSSVTGTILNINELHRNELPQTNDWWRKEALAVYDQSNRKYKAVRDSWGNDEPSKLGPQILYEGIA